MFEKYIEKVSYANYKEMYPHYDQLQIIYRFPNASYTVWVAVLYQGNITYNTPITSDVVGYISKRRGIAQHFKTNKGVKII